MFFGSVENGKVVIAPWIPAFAGMTKKDIVMTSYSDSVEVHESMIVVIPAKAGIHGASHS